MRVSVSKLAAPGIIALLCASVLSPCAPAFAEPSLYPTPGIANAATYTFEAQVAGDVTAFFSGSFAADSEVLGLLVNGVSNGPLGLMNHGTAIGGKLNFGPVLAGSVLTFFINDQTTGKTWYSNPSLNADLMNHVYATPFLGGVVPGTGSTTKLPAGIFIAFEDRGMPGSDRDYNDTSFVVTNVTTLAAPGPFAGAGLLPLIGLGAAWLARRPSKRPTA